MAVVRSDGTTVGARLSLEAYNRKANQDRSSRGKLEATEDSVREVRERDVVTVAMVLHRDKAFPERIETNRRRVIDRLLTGSIETEIGRYIVHSSSQ